MDIVVLLAKIDQFLRTHKGLSDNSLSKMAGKPDAIRNLRRYAAGEIKGAWTLDTLEAVAKTMGTTSWEMLRPPGDIARDGGLDDRINEILDERERRKAEAKPVRKRNSR